MTSAVLAPEAFDDVPLFDDPTPVDPGDQADDDAPYGRNPKTGKPYKRSPEWRAKLGEALNRGRQTQAAKLAPARKAAPRKAAGKTSGTDYRPAVAALLQVPAFALGAAGRYKPALALDAATITLHTPAIAEAVHQTAMSDDRVAAILDKVLAAGPYGALLGALLPVALQIAANHGAIQPVAELGILTPDQLVAALHQPTP